MLLCMLWLLLLCATQVPSAAVMTLSGGYVNAAQRAVAAAALRTTHAFSRSGNDDAVKRVHECCSAC